MNSNILLIILVLVCIAIFLFIMYSRAKSTVADRKQIEKLTMSELLDIVKRDLADLVKDENFVGLDNEEFKSAYERKAKIKDALKSCVYGIDSSKVIVLDLIRSVLMRELKTEEDILSVYDLKADFLDPRVKYEVLMYFYKKRHGKDAMKHWIEAYGLADPKYIIEDHKKETFAILDEEVDYTYKKENFELTYSAMIDILAILLYQQYKGFGIVDTLREMNINGINLGVSGSILSNILGSKSKKVMTAPRSVWIYYGNKYIHLRFMTFRTEEELRRVAQLMGRYNNPGPITEKRGYLVNTMYDKSRILIIRPPASEYWGVFIRKFTLSDASIEYLLVKTLNNKTHPLTQEVVDRLLAGEIIPGYINRPDLPIRLLYYMILGEITSAVTGRQGAGKTTLMAALVEFIRATYTIRVLEMAPELYLRELYPERNIFSVQETEYVTAQALQDALKKSDAAVSIVGEVATDAVAGRMIQMGRLASVFTIFSHHANTARDLIYAIRDSLVNDSGGSGDLGVAERNALDVIKADIHVDYTTTGERFVDNISCIIPLPESVPYPELDRKDLEWTKANVEREYYTRDTDRQTFLTREVLRYNRATKTYETGEWFPPEITERILASLPPHEIPGFKRFVKENWAV